MRYTEGPWWAEPSDDGSADGREVYDGYGHTATVYGEPDVAEANARLIAAAPELLAALREARDTLIELYEYAYPGDESDNDVTQTIDMAIAAIAKAEGGES